MQKYLMSILFFTILYSCSNPIARIDNEKKGTLVPTCQLVVSGEKKFSLDGETAPRITYSQFYIDSLGNRILTLLNSHNNSIYFFDYTNTSYLRKISYDRKGTNAILVWRDIILLIWTPFISIIGLQLNSYWLIV